jgi:hypothetical protein
MIIGNVPGVTATPFSAEVISNVLDKLDLEGLREGIAEVVGKAERNKALQIVRSR